MKKIENILNDINNNIENYYVGFNGCLYQDLTKEELFLIKNYIINLQKENKKLNNFIIDILLNELNNDIDLKLYDKYEKDFSIAKRYFEDILKNN